jgi:hypothetical protein
VWAIVARSSSELRARHLIEFLLLLGRKQGADLEISLLPEHTHLGPPIFSRERRIIPYRLPLRGVSLDDRRDLIFLFLREAERLAQTLELFHWVAWPARGLPQVGGFVIRSGRRLRGRRRDRLGFVGRADGGQGGRGQPGSDSCDSEH